MIAQYAIQFSDVESIEDLEREGLKVKGLSRKYEIGYCKTDLDFSEVLKLRKSFYLSSDEAASRFADIYDTRSRIFVCKQFGNCVGSVRLQITDHTEKLEFQSFSDLPSDFPKNFEVIELSRLVYDASYNEKLIVINLFRRSLYVAVESERNWIVASVLEKDFEKFKMLGFKKTSISYSLNVSPSQMLEHHMFIYDVKSSISKNKSFSARKAYIIENSMDLAIMKGSYNVAIFTRLKTKFLSQIYKILLSVINRR
jgi:N-acyl-L-homoserine lactone synthetase